MILLSKVNEATQEIKVGALYKKILLPLKFNRKENMGKSHIKISAPFHNLWFAYNFFTKQILN